jgi:hypothetical protein
MAPLSMVDASDEVRSLLSFNSGGSVAGPRRPPSSWWPPLTSAMIYLECSLPLSTLSLVVDLWGFSVLLSRMVAPAGTLGSTYLTPKKGGAELTPEEGGPTGLGPPRPSSGPSAPHFIFYVLGFLLLHMWTLDIVIPTTKLRGTHELPAFSSWSSEILHWSTLVLATFGGKFAHSRSSLIDLQNVLRTSCIFPHLIHEFMQKHYTPKCTSNGKLVISLAWLVAD